MDLLFSYNIKIKVNEYLELKLSKDKFVKPIYLYI